MRPEGDPWRSAVRDLIDREYPRGAWHPPESDAPARVLVVPKDGHAGEPASVSGAAEVLETMQFLSSFSGKPVHLDLANEGVLRNNFPFEGVIHGWDMELARAFLHAQGIAVLEVEEEKRAVLRVVDRSRLTEGNVGAKHGGTVRP